MKFCQLCQSLMRVENKRFICSCGNFEYIKESNNLKEKTAEPKKVSEEIASDQNTLATYNHICSVCGYDKAQLISKGIFYSDEDELIEYICGKCGHHDRDGDGKVS